MVSHYDLEYREGLYIDLHLPEGEVFDLLVYFHGGGLTAGSRKAAEAFAHTLAKEGVATASVEYRMYPDARYPDFIEDCAAAVRFMKDNMARFGTCRRFFVGGSSAGGYISMMLCFDERYLAAVGLSPDDVDGYIHDAGQPTAHFRVLKERGLDGRRVIVDETAPLYFVGARPSYRPMLFIVSDNDMVGRYEHTMLMVRTLAHFGHAENVFLREQHGKHCEYVQKWDENGEGVLGHIILDFIKNRMP